jgi:predicted permease
VPSLKETRGVVGTRRLWLRHTLVVVQVAVSVVLLVAAGLFIRTLQRATVVDVGFDLEQGMLASIDLLPGGYDQDAGVTFMRRLIDDVEAVPGVVSAGLARDIPLKLGGGSDTVVEVEGYVPADGEEMTVYYDRVSPGYFETLGLPLRAGRIFGDVVGADAATGVVINETMAARYFPGGDAVGRRLRIGDWVEVVGVVGDAKYTTLTAAPVNYLYLPLWQYYRPDVTLVVRTAGPPAAAMAPVRDRMKALDADLPLFDLRTMAEHRDVAVFMPRMAATLLGLFGTLALLLASVGLYGLLAFSVGQRTPEIGVRLALGAQRGDILHLVVWQGVQLTAIGAALGIALALAVLPLLSSQLVGTGPRDALSFGAAALLLLFGAAAASYVPARRAASVDPIRALRHE